MNINFIIALSGIILIILASTICIVFFLNKTKNRISEEVDDLNEEVGSSLEIINNNVRDINNLLDTYKKVIDEKNKELNKYKTGNEILRQKGLYISLIDILEFIGRFISESKNLDDKTKNYINATYDKLDIILTNSGIEMFNPELNQNLMEVEGCTPSLETTKTNDPNKVNLISEIVKHGYRLQINENEFIILKNSEVKVFELE